MAKALQEREAAPVRVSIVGGVAGRFNQTDNVHCSGVYSTGEEALQGIPSRSPDVALVDFNLPCMDGFECVVKLKARLPGLPVLMFTTGMTTVRSEHEALIFSAFHAGASGYLPQHLPLAEWLAAIELAHNGARCHRRVFLMFFDSDLRLGWSAKYWGKIAMMLKSSTATISYDQDWRTVVMSSKVIPGKVRLNSRHLAPAVKISKRARVAV